MFDTMRIGASAAGAYEIERSLRFNVEDSTKLTFTPSSTTNRRTFTLSFWFKIGQLGLSNGTCIFEGDMTHANGFMISRNSTGALYFYDHGVGSFQIWSDRLFKDPAAWYHCVFAADTENGTDTNRAKIYINGVQQDLSTWNVGSGANRYPPEDGDFDINQTNQMAIGTSGWGSDDFDGYLAEFHSIDGTQLDASSFGETNAVTGQWIPKKFAGSHGTNGFYLNFSDNSNTTAGTLGADSSGNGNNFTPTNFSVTADTTGNDSMVDTPTNNYCTLNPLHWNVLKGAGGLGNGTDLTQGNLRFVGSSDLTSPYQRSTGGTMSVTSGAWYYEATIENFDNGLNIGVAETTAIESNGYWEALNGGFWGWNPWDTARNINTTTVSYGSKPSNGDVIGVAFDIDNNTIEWFVNNTGQGEATGVALSGKRVIPMISLAFYAQKFCFNFGQQGFKYDPPTGFKALCTANLPEPTIKKGSDHFNTVLYTGNGSTQSITGVGFQSDFTWIKIRNDSASHFLTDSVTGVQKELNSDTSNAQSTNANALTAFGTDGFSVGTEVGVNWNTKTFVAWNWKGGGSASSNGDGDITSSVSANAPAGFSIVKFTGDGNDSTVGHGLGVAPEMIITKNTEDSGTSWDCYHINHGHTKYLHLDTDSIGGTADWINDTAPASSVFTVGDGGYNVNTSGEVTIAYCFNSVEGYSEVGFYRGTGQADGPVVFTGFKPAFVLIKRIDATENWWLYDNVRDTGNPHTQFLYANTTTAEQTGTGDNIALDFISNGIKLRTANVNWNASGGTYIYLALAESPFKYATAR